MLSNYIFEVYANNRRYKRLRLAHHVQINVKSSILFYLNLMIEAQSWLTMCSTLMQCSAIKPTMCLIKQCF